MMMAQPKIVPMTGQDIVYRINVAVKKLGVSRNTIYRLVKSGDLELVKIGARASGITAESIDHHLSKGRKSDH